MKPDTRLLRDVQPENFQVLLTEALNMLVFTDEHHFRPRSLRLNLATRVPGRPRR